MNSKPISKVNQIKCLKNKESIQCLFILKASEDSLKPFYLESIIFSKIGFFFIFFGLEEKHL